MAADAPFLNPTLRDGESLAQSTDDVGIRHARIFEKNLPGRIAHHGGPEALALHARRFHVDDETGYAPSRAFFRIGHCDDLSVIRGLRSGNEALGAVDDPVITILHGAGLHPRRVAAGVRFRLRDADLFLAANDRKEKPFSLFLVAVEQHRSDFGSEDRRVTKRYRHGARHFLHDHTTAHEIEPGAAVFLRHVKQPKTDRFGFLLQRFDVWL